MEGDVLAERPTASLGNVSANHLTGFTVLWSSSSFRMDLVALLVCGLAVDAILLLTIVNNSNNLLA